MKRRIYPRYTSQLIPAIVNTMILGKAKCVHHPKLIEF